MFSAHNTRSKYLQLTVVLLLSPLVFWGQQLTGLWTGVLSNDSTSIRKDQSFEIALTEYRGKVYGYSRSEFIVNDTLYYILKRVKGTIDGDVCEVKDDEIVSYNFPRKIDKGIKVTSTFYRNKVDSTWQLAGKWTTNKTKNYYALTGSVALKEEKDLSASKIFPHLEELKLADDVAFYKERKTQTAVIKTAEPEDKRLSSAIRAEQQSTLAGVPDLSLHPDISVGNATPVAINQVKVIRTNTEPVKTATLDLPTQTGTTVANTEVKDEVKKPSITPINTSVSKGNTVANADIKETVKKAELPPAKTIPIKQTVVATEKPVTKPSATFTSPVNAPVTASTNQEIKKQKPVTTTATSNPVTTKPVATIATPEELKKSVDAIIEKTGTVAGRKSIYSRVVDFKSDSLELSLYDNGEIDGDSVSVFMNGKVLMDHQGLKATAIKKTIYLTPGKDDEFTLVLFAENLGKYPPNTGLLVVHDGDDVYNILFSADLQTNAGMVFRRKK